MNNPDQGRGRGQGRGHDQVQHRTRSGSGSGSGSRVLLGKEVGTRFGEVWVWLRVREGKLGRRWVGT